MGKSNVKTVLGVTTAVFAIGVFVAFALNEASHRKRQSKIRSAQSDTLEEARARHAKETAAFHYREKARIDAEMEATARALDRKATAQREQVERARKQRVTLEKFTSLSKGMTLDEVSEVMGCESSDIVSGFGDEKSIIRDFGGREVILGTSVSDEGSVTAYFRGGRLVDKTFFPR